MSTDNKGTDDCQASAAVAAYSVPSKREDREASVYAGRLLGIGRWLSFHRVLWAEFPNPMMMAIKDVSEDHCIYLLAEEAALDKIQNAPPRSEKRNVSEAEKISEAYAELMDLANWIKGLPQYTTYAETRGQFEMLWVQLDWVMGLVSEILDMTGWDNCS